jgi:ribosomal protein L16/L10AE
MKRKNNTSYTQKKTKTLIQRKQIFPKIIKIKQKKNIIDIKTNIISIIAKRNQILTEKQINKIKDDLIKLSNYFSSFKINVLIFPFKSLTKKGILVRMGSGKGKLIDKYLIIIKNKKCLEIIYKINNNNKINELILLNSFLKKYKFFKLFKS